MKCSISYCSKGIQSGERHINDEQKRNELGLTNESSVICLECYDMFVIQNVNIIHLEFLKKNVQDECDRSTIFHRKLIDIENKSGIINTLI